MKKPISSLFIFAAAICVADARLINSRNFRDLDKGADFIVVGKPIVTIDTAEETNLTNIGPAIPVIGVSSEFEVRYVLKGDETLKKIVVHHYRLADPNQGLFNGPLLSHFDPKEDSNYLLFLQREPDGRYAPYNQTDSAMTSILKLEGPKWNTMTLAEFKHWLDAMKWLNKGPMDLSALIPPGGTGEGSLHEAAFNGKLEKAKQLIESHPELVLSHNSIANQTPLHLAAQYGHKDIVELLLANKADVEAKADGGWTPLLNAVLGGHKEIVELLVAHKADVNVMDDVGRAPLHVAAENGHAEIAALLLTHKAEINAVNNVGMMPLHVAASGGHKEMVELLLANKAEINARDRRRLTPLGYAIKNNHKDMTELLRQRGGVE
jgi:ankyrin repeat protein